MHGSSSGHAVGGTFDEALKRQRRVQAVFGGLQAFVINPKRGRFSARLGI